MFKPGLGYKTISQPLNITVQTKDKKEYDEAPNLPRHDRPPKLASTTEAGKSALVTMEELHRSTAQVEETTVQLFFLLSTDLALRKEEQEECHRG